MTVALLVLLAAALVALFAALNWSTLNASVPVSLGPATVEAAPGVIVLGFALGFALALLAYVAWQRTAQLIDARRNAQELRALRALAEDAEASRRRELRAELARDFAALRGTIEESANGLAASIGQLDEKLARARPAELPPPS
jgi:uncharacterized integral membrane protein